MLRFDSTIDIDAPPPVVWEWIRQPEFIAEWNEKLVAHETRDSTPAETTKQYRFTYRMSERERSCEAEITRHEDPTWLEWTYQGTTPQPWTVVETFQLAEHPNGTRLTRRLDLTHAPLPFWARPLIWLIIQFGKPVGRSQLEQLKRLAEE